MKSRKREKKHRQKEKYFFQPTREKGRVSTVQQTYIDTHPNHLCLSFFLFFLLPWILFQILPLQLFSSCSSLSFSSLSFELKNSLLLTRRIKTLSFLSISHSLASFLFVFFSPFLSVVFYLPTSDERVFCSRRTSVNLPSNPLAFLLHAETHTHGCRQLSLHQDKHQQSSQ